jgi:hypothetical protein
MALKAVYCVNLIPSQLSRLLELPGHVEPLILIAMGFSPIEPKEMTHLELGDFLHHEKW